MLARVTEGEKGKKVLIFAHLYKKAKGIVKGEDFCPLHC